MLSLFELNNVVLFVLILCFHITDSDAVIRTVTYCNQPTAAVELETSLLTGVANDDVELRMGHDFFAMRNGIVWLGDLDGNGVDDVAIGARGDTAKCYEPTQAEDEHGAVHILFLDSTGGIINTVKIGGNTIVTPMPAAFGRNDPSDAIGSLPGPGPQPCIGFKNFGRSIAAADFDGDGNIDLAVGALKYNQDKNRVTSMYPGPYATYSVSLFETWKTGAVYLLYLNSDGTFRDYDEISHNANLARVGAYTSNGLGSNLELGDSLVAIGDLDGDSNEDLVANGRSDYQMWVFFLQTNGAHPADCVKDVSVIDYSEGSEEGISVENAAMIYSWNINRNFGDFMVNIGDFDLDGVNDIVAGHGTHDNGNGALFIVYMEVTGTVKDVSIIESPSSNNGIMNFGGSGAMAGDLNADGVEDLIVGAERIDDSHGGFYIVLLNDDFTMLKWTEISAAVYSSISLLPEANDRWFYAMATTVSDFNNDGIKDVIVQSLKGLANTASSAPYYETNLWILPIDICDCTGTNRTGSQCQTDCLNDGFNVDGSGCDCTFSPNHVGATCQIFCNDGMADHALDQCDCTGTNSLTVNGNGCSKSCNGGMANYTTDTCDCTDSGATGKYCTEDVDDCFSDPCVNGGVCSDDGTTPHEFNCTCLAEWAGTLCERTSFCDSSPCLSNGVCEFASVTNAFCNCSYTGYEGDFCETEINECSSAPCMHDGLCIDLVASFTCDCAGTGYEGASCSTDIDDCSSSPCENDGTCQDKGANKFKCTCNEFWEGNVCTEDVDDCILKGYYCENGAGCADDPVNMGDVLCDCSTSEGGFTGKYCNVPIEDACVTFNPCFNGGKCILDDITKEMSCDCRDTGYEGDVCDTQVYVSECVSSPCLNEGQCYDPSDQQDDWYCVCVNTVYSGELCEITITACDSMPCQNGGTCINDLEIGGYTCQCVSGFAGAQCTELEIDQVVGDLSSSSSTPNDNSDVEDTDEAISDKKEDNTIIIIAIVAVAAVILGVLAFFQYSRKQKSDTYSMPT